TGFRHFHLIHAAADRLPQPSGAGAQPASGHRRPDHPRRRASGIAAAKRVETHPRSRGIRAPTETQERFSRRRVASIDGGLSLRHGKLRRRGNSTLTRSNGRLPVKIRESHGKTLLSPRTGRTIENARAGRAARAAAAFAVESPAAE